jgi:hypothetical protein
MSKTLIVTSKCMVMQWCIYDIIFYISKCRLVVSHTGLA